MLFSYKKTRLFMLIGMMFGVICGTFIFNCIKDMNKNNLVIYYNYLIGRMDFNKICRKDYFIYVFVNRTKEIILLIILGLTSYRVIFHSLFLWYFGVKNSILIGLFTIAKGKSAVLWYLLFTQPQMLLYVIIVYYIIKRMDFNELFHRKRNLINEILKIVIAVILMSCTECFVNLFIISKFI